MPARKLYDDYYESGSTAKKYSNYTKIEPRKNVKVGKNKRNQTKAKHNVSIIFFILSIFAVAMVITYRYNMISEKNFQAQNLQSELTKVESALVTSQIEVEQGTDLDKIEDYAKQQLGMQKPDKNQTIYVDTSTSNTSVEVGEIENIFTKIVDGIKDFINKIF